MPWKEDELMGAKTKEPKLPFEAVSLDPPVGRELPLQFDGRATEYFRIWIVCQLLVVLTLGLYAPWARLRKQRYIAQHWSVDGLRFDVNFDPMAKLKGRLLLLAGFVVSLALSFAWSWLLPICLLVAYFVAPWLLTSSSRFNWRTLRLGDYAFELRSKAKVIKKPLWLLGLALSAWLAHSLFVSYATLGVWGVAVKALVNLPFVFLIFLWLYPTVTSHLLYQKFAHVKLGEQAFHLNAKPRDIVKFFRSAAIGNKWLFALLVTVTVVINLSALFLIANREISGFINSLTLTLLSIYGVSMARHRRINFIAHRLRIGPADAGIRFQSTLDATNQAMRTVGYAFLGILTLGLSLAWSSIHFQHWRAKHFQIYLEGDWSQFANQFTMGSQLTSKSAVIEELAQAYEIDLGL